MSTIRLDPPKAFSFVAKEWPSWKAHFERFRNASGLAKNKDEEQIDTLIYVMGIKAEEISKSFVYSKSGDEKIYDQVLAKFDAHFLPRKNVIHERYLFHTRSQRKGESAEEFVTALHSLAENCNFGTFKDESIRDRIVVGIADPDLSKQLQLISELTLQKAIDVVRANEDVDKQQEAQRAAKKELLEQVSAIDRVYDRNRGKPNRSKRTECSRCGESSHARDACPAKHAKCHKCHRYGHFAKMCGVGASSSGNSSNCSQLSREQSKKQSSKPRHKVSEIAEESDGYTSSGDDSPFFIGAVSSSCSERSEDQYFKVEIDVGGVSRCFKIDSGARRTVMSPHHQHPDYPSKEPDAVLEGAGGCQLNTLSMQTLPLVYRGKTIYEKVYYVQGQRRPLLGRPAIKKLRLLRRVNAILGSTKVEVPYTELFKGLGKMPGEYLIILADNAKPFVLTVPQKIPFPLQGRVKTMLDKQVKQGIISRVTEPTDWVAPIVIAPKAGGGIRLCVDLSRLNASVKRSHHPIPAVEETLAKLAGGTVFSKLDANSGFHQIPLAKESRLLTTFITPWGRYCFNRLPFGITSAPEYFQVRMTQMLEGCRNTVCHMDDILVWGKDEKEHDECLMKVFERIKASGMTLNKEKCVFRARKLKFLGHHVEGGKVHADHEKTTAIAHLAAPSNKKELQSILGSVNFLARHIPDRATVLVPLYELLKGNREFLWEIAQQDTFDKLKKLLESPQVLAVYDVHRPTTISCDTSSYGIGAVMLQQDADGNQRPVAYVSQTLTNAEKNFAQIEKEALAITWACNRLQNFLIGLNFTIETDHKPLVPILTTKFLDDLTPRLLRLRLKLQRFHYKVIHVPGKNLVVADLLSRKPVGSATKDDEIYAEEVTYAAINSVEMLSATPSMLQRIREAQSADIIGKDLRQCIDNGWPKSSAETPENLIPYRRQQASLHVTGNLILFKNRLWIPSSLRQSILEKLHASHFGVTKTSALARTSVWWPNLEADIAKCVAGCSSCAETRVQRSEPLMPTRLPDRPWCKLGLDLLKEEGKWYVVLIDYYSKYLELAHIPKLDSQTVISRLEAIFARFGIPEEIFTDNGTQLVSEEMKKFAREYDFKITTRSPAYPQSNGLAEAAVKIAKKVLRSNSPSLALLHYRAAPTSTGYSPAQLLFSRNVRTTVPSVNLGWKKHTHSQVKMRDAERQVRMKRNFDRAKGTRPLSELKPGNRVYVEDANQKGEIISKREEPRSYDIRLDNGSILRRNRKALHELPPSKTPTPESPPKSDSSSKSSTPLPSPAKPRLSTSAPSSPKSKTPSPCQQYQQHRQSAHRDRRRSCSITQPSPKSKGYSFRTLPRVRYNKD